ncbi:MAG TPA: hypothetical protein VF588_05920 [Pyrinomonadaceae bacterium]
MASVSLLLASCTQQQAPAPGPSPSPARADVVGAGAPGCAPVSLTIDANSINPPTDIPGGAGSATLQSAAVFAWQEFIALNWPAVTQNGGLNTRDQPDPKALFGDPKYSGAQAVGPLVWHTFRHKVEIFPGTGQPHGYTPDATKFFGYDHLPQYVYANGPTSGGGGTTPWINLDEQSEIGLDTMYAGNAPTDPFPGQQILFMAKANRAEYAYVAANGWWIQSPAPFNPPPNVTVSGIANAQKYIASFNSGNDPNNPIQNYTNPPPGSTTVPAGPDDRASLPNNTIEIKTGWRQLTPTEAGSGRFYTTTVRYYVNQGGNVGYKDAVWGMVALHIIQKTPSAPYFIYATFSQADNLLDAAGNKVEDENGKLLQTTGTPLDPDVTSKNATAPPPTGPTQQTIQQLSPATSTTQPGKRVYYSNTPDTPTTQGLVALNRRKHDIPQCVIDVNTAAHNAITTYNNQNNLGTPVGTTVWNFYKLVNVQYQPYDKPAGTTYTGAPGGPDPSTYYQANEMVETDYNLQVFSGHFQPEVQGLSTAKLITDYNNDGSVFRNTFYSTPAPNSGKAANMGGCMGCHANAQVAGGDFSFIFQGGRVLAPEVATGPTGTSPAGVAKFRRLLQRPSTTPPPTP